MPTEAATESAYAWLRLAICAVLSTLGGISLWSVVVVLPAVQQEFGVDRATASLPYTFTMIGFAIGGVLMGRLADRFGIMVPALIGAVALSIGYISAAEANSLWQFTAAQGVLIAFGGAATFGPMVADVSHWFTRRRGIAVAVAASGNYLAGTVWPPLVQHFVQSIGLRGTLTGIGVLCAVTMIPLALMLRRRPPAHVASVSTHVSTASLGLSPAALQATLAVAGFCCCVAMSMPQVHIVAYCGDLGYGFTRGTEMLSLMLGLGIFSRVGSGFIADRLGGLPTLLIGSVGADAGAVALSRLYRAGATLCDLGAVWIGAGRHYSMLRHYHSRIPAGARGWDAVRGRDYGNAVRDGVWRLDFWRDLRCYRIVSRSVREWRVVECAECVHRDCFVELRA